jgi:SAM-dependent methyltransferase
LDTSPGTYTIDECTHCGFALLNPAPTGDLSQYYPTHYLSQEGDGSSSANSLLSRAERAYRYDQYRFDFGLLHRASGLQISRADSYVDVGCGSGERVQFASRSGCERAVGIDRYQFAKRSSHQSAQFVDTEILDFVPPDRFEVASLFHVLEHVEDPIGILTHLRESVLTRDGWIIVQVPNYGSLERRIFGRRWAGLDVPRHLFHFDARALRRSVQAAGYDVQEIYRVNAPLHSVTLVPSIAPSLDVQRIWVRPGSAAFKIAAQALWAVATLATVPLAMVMNWSGSGSMLTVVARPAR